MTKIKFKTQWVFYLFTFLCIFRNYASGNVIKHKFKLDQLEKPPERCDAQYESSEEACLLGWGFWGNDKPDEDQFAVRYFMYKGHPDHLQEVEIFMNNSRSISAANPIRNAPWKILVHGFTNNKDSTFPVNVRDAYLQYLQKNPLKRLNILVFDWGKGAEVDWFGTLTSFKLSYSNAAKHVKIAGEQLGKMILYLNKNEFLQIQKVAQLYDAHLIGHSLGSHVAWHAARYVFNEKRIFIKRISALDPAGPYFSRQSILSWVRDPLPRIHRNRVAFLDVYHTSEKYGLQEEVGDVDFYINGGKVQPSCPYWTKRKYQHTMKAMINAYVHSVIEYGIEIWAVQSEEKLKLLQNKINRFLLHFLYPNLLRSKKKRGKFRRVKICINNDVLTKCNFMTVSERRDYVILKKVLKQEVEICKMTANVDKLFEPYKTKIIPSFKSETFKNSLIYKSVKMWNSLPRDFTLGLNCSKDYMKDFVCSSRATNEILF